MPSTTGSTARAAAPRRGRRRPPGRPSVPVASATAATSRSTAGRAGSAITARSASCTGVSSSSRSAASSDGTPRPPSRSASRPQTPAASASSRSSQNTRVSYARSETCTPRSRISPTDRRYSRPGSLLAHREPSPVRRSVGQAQAVRQRPAHHRLRPVGRLERERDRVPDPARGLGVAVVVDDQRPRRRPIRSSTRTRARRRPRRRRATSYSRKSRASAKSPRRWRSGTISRSWRSISQLVGLLVHRRPAELHPVLLGEPLELAVPEHRQPRQRRQQRGHADVLVALAELLGRRLLVGVVHEVDVALEDLGVELEGLLEHLAVARVVLVAEHVHERASCRRGACPGSGRSSPRAARTPRRAAACRGPRRRPGRRRRARTRSASRRRSRPATSSRTRPATGSRRRPRRAPGTTAAGRASSRSTIAASKRMTGNRRATSTIVRITCSRTAAWLKSSWAVSFHGKLVPSLPW